MSVERQNPAGGVVSDTIYVAGGFPSGGSPTIHSSGEAYDPGTDSWSSIASMPAARTGSCSAVDSGLLYVGGGSTSLAVSGAVATWWAYDPGTDTWDSTLTAMPAARVNAQAVAVGGTIYVVGGVSAGGSAHSTIWAYDPGTDTWDSTLASAPVTLTSGCVFTADGDVVYAGGLQGGSRSAVVRVYDPGGDSWSTSTSLAEAVDSSGFAGGDGYYMALAGGQTSTVFTRQSWRGFVGHSWPEMTDLPEARYQSIGVMLDGWLHIIGGRAGSTGTAKRTHYRARVPKVGQWSVGAVRVV